MAKVETTYRCLDCARVFQRVDGPGGGDCPFCGFEYLERLRPFPVIVRKGAIKKMSGTSEPNP